MSVNMDPSTRLGTERLNCNVQRIFANGKGRMLFSCASHSAVIQARHQRTNLVSQKEWKGGATPKWRTQNLKETDRKSRWRDPRCVHNTHTSTKSQNHFLSYQLKGGATSLVEECLKINIIKWWALFSSLLDKVVIIFILKHIDSLQYHHWHIWIPWDIAVYKC